MKPQKQTKNKIKRQGTFIDLTPTWYKNIGKSILISLILGILIRGVKLLVRVVEKRWAMARRAKCTTQADLEKCYEGPPFQLAERCARLARPPARPPAPPTAAAATTPHRSAS